MPNVIVVLIVIAGTSFPVVFGKEGIQDFPLITLASSHCVKHTGNGKVSVSTSPPLELELHGSCFFCGT
jgi:hypothetical protein